MYLRGSRHLVELNSIISFLRCCQIACLLYLLTLLFYFISKSYLVLYEIIFFCKKESYHWCCMYCTYKIFQELVGCCKIKIIVDIMNIVTCLVVAASCNNNNNRY